MKKQRARTSDEKEYRREQLKKAALQLFATKGFKGTTVSMITKKARLSPAAFYLYFHNKIEIYRELNKDGIAILEELMNKALNKDNKNSVAVLNELAQAYYTFFKDYTEYFYITEILHLGNSDFFLDTRMVDDLEEKTLVLLKMVARVIENGIKNRELKKVDPLKTAVTLWGMIDGVLILEVKKSSGFTGFAIEDCIKHMMKMVVHGIEKK